MPAPIDLTAFQGADLPTLARGLGLDYTGFGGMPPRGAETAFSQPSKFLGSAPAARPILPMPTGAAPAVRNAATSINPQALLMMLRALPGILGPAGIASLAGGSEDPGVRQFRYNQATQAPPMDATGMDPIQPKRLPALGVAGQRF